MTNEELDELLTRRTAPLPGSKIVFMSTPTTTGRRAKLYLADEYVGEIDSVTPPPTAP